VTHDTEDAFRTINELEAQRTKENKKKSVNMQKVIEEEMRETEPEQAYIAPHESEGLVEWDDSAQSKDRSSSKKPANVVLKGIQISGSEEGTIPIFAFSGIDESTKENNKKIIENLGGKCDVTNFTHLISKLPNSSEKYTTALASARFILNQDYIEECEKQGRFVDESKFEYGNPRYEGPLADSIDKRFIAAYKWRKWAKFDHRARFEDGAFTGMVFIAAVSDSFKNILIAGGGKIVDLNFTKKFDEAFIKRERVGICLVDSMKLLSKENEKVLINCNVKMGLTKTINTYLLSDQPPMQFM